MSHGLTWEEETLALIREAQAQALEAQTRAEEAKEKVRLLTDYIASLEEALKIRKEIKP